MHERGVKEAGFFTQVDQAGSQGNRLTGSGIWVLPVPVPPTKMRLWASWVNWPEQKGSICACLTAAAL